MKKMTTILCVAAFFLVFGCTGVSFAGSVYPEGTAGRECSDIPDDISEYPGGEILTGMFTVSVYNSTTKIVHIYLTKHVQVLINGELKPKKESHLFSFIEPSSNYLYDETTEECLAGDPLASAFSCYPYLLGVDLAFGLDGFPIIEELEVTECEPGLLYPGSPYLPPWPTETQIDDMISGKILIRVVPAPEP